MKSKPKKKTLPDGIEKLLESADLTTLQAVFDSCEVDARGGYSKVTALMMPGCPDLARWLVANGADVGAVDRSGNTALHARARRRHPGGGSVEVLIELGCDVNAGDGAVGTPLHAAADAKNARAVATLLAHGAKVDATRRGGHTPLSIAVHGCTNADLTSIMPVVRQLLDAGAKRPPEMQAAVRRIGETFEFHRTRFDPASREAASAGLTGRLAELAVEWVLANPEPAPLSKPSYLR